MKKLEFSEEQWKKIFDAIEEQVIYEIKSFPWNYNNSAAPFAGVWNLLEEYDVLSIKFYINKIEHMKKYDRATDKLRIEYRFQLECYCAEYTDAADNQTELPMEFCNAINAKFGDIEIIHEE